MHCSSMEVLFSCEHIALAYMYCSSTDELFYYKCIGHIWMYYGILISYLYP